MKKILFPLLALFVLAISACSNEDEGGINKDNETNTMYEDRHEANDETNKNNNEDSDHKQAENQTSLDDEDLPDGYMSKNIAQLEEVPTIASHIDLEKLVAEVEADIPNKRIILFKNNDTNDLVYKSIYIKDDRHLKIVELANDHLIYNGTAN